jgi:hypothetical protein
MLAANCIIKKLTPHKIIHRLFGIFVLAFIKLAVL